MKRNSLNIRSFSLEPLRFVVFFKFVFQTDGSPCIRRINIAILFYLVLIVSMRSPTWLCSDKGIIIMFPFNFITLTFILSIFVIFISSQRISFLSPSLVNGIPILDLKIKDEIYYLPIEEYISASDSLQVTSR